MAGWVANASDNPMDITIGNGGAECDAPTERACDGADARRHKDCHREAADNPGQDVDSNRHFT
jgi:hypothetical protein